MQSRMTVAGAPALLALTRRAIVTTLRLPALCLSPVSMSLFFLVIYEGQFGSAGPLLLDGGRYVDFVLPLVLLTTAFAGGAPAGQLMVRDIRSGYHQRLLLTGVRASTLVLAPVLAGATVLVAQAVVVVGAGYALGMRPSNGLAAAVCLVGVTVAAGIGFSLLAVTAALWAGTDAAVQSVTMIFFPLSFLTGAFVPRPMLTGWMGVAADLNPLSYLLDGARALLKPHGHGGTVAGGLVTVAALLVLGCAACAIAFRHREGAR